MGIGMIVDIIDPNNPQIVGTFPVGHNIFIDDRGYMYVSAQPLAIYDLNPDPTSPQFLTQLFNGAHDVSVEGNLLYSFNGEGGTIIYDVTDPSAPIQLSVLEDPSIFFHTHGDISTDGMYLYISDEFSYHPLADISVWDITVLNDPFIESVVVDPDALAHNLFVIEDYLYVAYFTAGLKVFDITDPSNPILADEYDTNPFTGEIWAGSWALYPSPITANIYVNDETGVYIFGFSELLSIEDKVNSFNFSVYPNPTNGKININASNFEINTISLFDIQGRKLEEINNLNILSNYELDLSKYNSGIYFINVNNRQTKKVILN